MFKFIKIKMSENRIIGLTRLTTLVCGAGFSLLITHRLISDFGIPAYAAYVIFTSIPNLIPFADLGLGLNVFNVYANHNPRKSFNASSRKRISLSFYIICTVSVIAIAIFFLLFKTQIFNNFFQSHFPFLHDVKAFIIICALFVSTPFTLGFRKMYANGQVFKATLIGFLIPLINFIITFSLIHFSTNINQWIILAPSISYLLANIFAFLSSDVLGDLVLLPLKYIKQNSAHIVKFAIHATLFSSMVAIMLQAPKFLFAYFQEDLSVAKYSIFLLVVTSIGSLISAYASIYVPNYKRIGYVRETKSYLKPTKRHLVTIATGALICFLLLPIIIEKLFNINFSNSEILVSVLSIVIYLGWVYYNSFLTEIEDLKVLITIGIGTILFILILFSLTGFNSYITVMLVIWSQFFTFLLLVSVFRVFKFRGIENA